MRQYKGDGSMTYDEQIEKDVYIELIDSAIAKLTRKMIEADDNTSKILNEYRFELIYFLKDFRFSSNPDDTKIAKEKLERINVFLKTQ